MKAFYEPEAAGDFVWALVGSPLGLLAGYLAVVSLWAFGLMWFDKMRSKRRGARRVRERTLFLSALLGGSPGAILGMWLFHHKTKHWYFVWGMPLILLAQAGIGIFLWRTFSG